MLVVVNAEGSTFVVHATSRAHFSDSGHRKHARQQQGAERSVMTVQRDARHIYAECDTHVTLSPAGVLKVPPAEANQTYECLHALQSFSSDFKSVLCIVNWLVTGSAQGTGLKVPHPYMECRSKLHCCSILLLGILA